MNLASLAVLRNYLTLAEHKAGTVKVKVAFSALSDPNVQKVIAEFKNQKMPKAILDTKVNIFTQTITIKYDTDCINANDFEELLTTKDEERFLRLAEEYHAKLLS